MQRTVVRRARTRDASPAQADGPHPARLAGAPQRVADPDRPNFRFCRQPPCAWVLFGRTSTEQKLESRPNSSRISVQHQTPSKRKPADQSSTATSPDAIQSHTSSPPLERRSALDVAGFRRVCIARHHSDCPGQFRFPGRHPVSNSAGESRARKRYREHTAKWNQKWNRW